MSDICVCHLELAFTIKHLLLAFLSAVYPYICVWYVELTLLTGFVVDIVDWHFALTFLSDMFNCHMLSDILNLHLLLIFVREEEEEEKEECTSS